MNKIITQIVSQVMIGLGAILFIHQDNIFKFLLGWIIFMFGLRMFVLLVVDERVS